MSKTTTSSHRGHPMYFDDSTQVWRYADNGESVGGVWTERPCGICGRRATDQGHDPCIANLPGVLNACCGHGVTSEAYVQLESGIRLGGEDAAAFFLRTHGPVRVTGPVEITTPGDTPDTEEKR